MKLTDDELDLVIWALEFMQGCGNGDAAHEGRRATLEGLVFRFMVLRGDHLVQPEGAKHEVAYSTSAT